MAENHYLLFKWGTLKGWNVPDGECLELLKKYFADGQPLGCAADRPGEDRKKILCDLIDKFDGTMSNDWDGNEYTKDEAKKYVMEYGK
jgi:hypothetical protein